MQDLNCVFQMKAVSGAKTTENQSREAKEAVEENKSSRSLSQGAVSQEKDAEEPEVQQKKHTKLKDQAIGSDSSASQTPKPNEEENSRTAAKPEKATKKCCTIM